MKTWEKYQKEIGSVVLAENSGIGKLFFLQCSLERRRALFSNSPVSILVSAEQDLVQDDFAIDFAGFRLWDVKDRIGWSGKSEEGSAKRT